MNFTSLHEWFLALKREAARANYAWLINNEDEESYRVFFEDGDSPRNVLNDMIADLGREV